MSNLNLLTEEVITLTEVRNFLPEVQGQKRPMSAPFGAGHFEEWEE
jgi:hypothetical protein